MKQESRPVSTRISLDEFAKVIDSLIEKGVPTEKLISNSNIVKTALLIMIIESANPTGPASESSKALVEQLWQGTKAEKTIDINNLYSSK